MPTYICVDCSIGEKKPCTWECLNPDQQKPVSCPLGLCGEDAVWHEAEGLSTTASSTQGPGADHN